MSKTNNDKKAIQKGIEEQNNYYKQKNEKKKIPDDPARPNLLKRVASILLDTLIIMVTIVVLYLLSSVTIFHPLNYYKYKDEATQINMNSGLYNEKYGENITYLQFYDSKKTPEENLDVPLTKFYSTYEYAVNKNLIESYNKSKLSSGLFEYNSNNEIVRKKDITDSMVKSFLSTQYEKALDILHSNTKYVIATNYTYNVMVATIIFCSMISFTIFFLTVPILSKEHSSIGQKICGLSCVNSEDKTPSTKKQITIRFIIIYLMNGLLPIGLFTLWGFEVMGVPFLIVLIMISFSRTNSGPHEYLSHTKVINKSRSNAFEILESMKEQTEAQKLNNPHYYSDEKIHYTDEE